MEHYQRIVLLVAAALIVLMGLVPPFAYFNGSTKLFVGYSFIWDRPTRVPVDTALLITQWVGVLLAAGIAWFAVKGLRPPRNVRDNAGRSHPVSATTAPDSALEFVAASPYPPKPAAGPIGIDGWLGLLVFVLMLMGPLVVLSNTQKSLEALQLLEQLPYLRVATLADISLSLAVSAFGFAAGLALFGLKPKGPLLARSYFWIVLIYYLLAPIVFLAIAESSPVRDEDHRALVDASVNRYAMQFMTGAPFAIAWLVYLRVSKRVRATFGEPGVSPTWGSPRR